MAVRGHSEHYRQTSCLALLKGMDCLGKLYGGDVRPQWVMALLLLY